MPNSRLSDLDLQRLLTSGAHLAVEAGKLEIQNLRGVVNQQNAEVQYLKAQLAVSEVTRTNENSRRQAAAAHQAAKGAHDALAAEIGKTYGVDWRESVFCPQTGEIHAILTAPRGSSEDEEDTEE